MAGVIIGSGVSVIATVPDAERAYGKGSLLATKARDWLDPNRLRTTTAEEAARRRALVASFVPMLVNGQRWWSDARRTCVAPTKAALVAKIVRRGGER